MTESEWHLLVQVTDISTFTDDKKRAEVDAWLYETCTQCLQHIIDITVKFYPVVQPLLGRVLELLLNFIRSDISAMHLWINLASSITSINAACMRPDQVPMRHPLVLPSRFVRYPHAPLQICEPLLSNAPSDTW